MLTVDRLDVWRPALGGLPLLKRDLYIVKFLELRERSDHVLSVTWQSSDGIFGEPHDFEVLQGHQVLDLVEALHHIATDVKFLQIVA